MNDIQDRDITVLLADDHPALRAGLRARLDAADGICVVAEASDGAEALELIREHRPDVAVVDLRMPKIDGLELVESATKEGLSSRLVLLSALVEGHLVQRAMDLGAVGYVGKESPLEVIVDAVRTVVGGNRYIDPTLVAGLLAPTDQRLSDRELEVLQLAANGMQNKVIAIELGLSEETIKTHLSNVMRKLDANSRTEAVSAALRRSLIR